MAALFLKISGRIIRGDFDQVNHLTKQAIDDRVPAKDVLDKGLLVGMEIFGKKFKTGELFIPEVLRSVKSMYEAMGVLNHRFQRVIPSVEALLL